MIRKEEVIEVTCIMNCNYGDLNSRCPGRHVVMVEGEKVKDTSGMYSRKFPRANDTTGYAR